MRLTSQRRIAAQILKAGKNRIVFDTEKLSEIKEAITRADIRSLISEKIIKAKPLRGPSRFRARKIKIQKSKGRRKGPGSRKGAKNSRITSKRRWILKVRIQRRFIKLLRDKKVITPNIYRDIYKKIKGNYFRSKRHVKLYLEEHKLTK
jgi:large subunit ribosomal protein L19e